MTRMKYLVAAATLSLFLAGCSGSKEEVPDNPPNEIYATAQQKLQDGNWRQAITQLEALDNRYPFGPYSQQVQLDLIYAYYKNADLPLAQAAIDRFIRLNPTHPNIDYVMYMRGLTNMALKLQDGNWRQAITQLEALDNRYPFGPYSQQVQLDLIYAYYKNADLPLEQAAIDRVIRLNPTHPNIDYVMYMRGLTNMALDDSALQGFFGVDRSDRDPQHARAAFSDFSKLVRGYPNSQYSRSSTCTSCV